MLEYNCFHRLSTIMVVLMRGIEGFADLAHNFHWPGVYQRFHSASVNFLGSEVGASNVIEWNKRMLVQNIGKSLAETLGGLCHKGIFCVPCFRTSKRGMEVCETGGGALFKFECISTEIIMAIIV